MRIYEVTTQFKFRNIASYGNAFLIVSLANKGDILVIADFLKSVVYLRLNEQDHKLEQIGYDPSIRWVTSIENLDNENDDKFTIFGSDMHFNLFGLNYVSKR